MPYKKCYTQRIKGNQYKVHLWEEDGYKTLNWTNYAYRECALEDATHTGLKGEPLMKVSEWDNSDNSLHFHDITPYQKFLIERYGDDDSIPTSHRELFFDIEIEMGGALTQEYIREAPKPITSIAWWDRTLDIWEIVILDPENKIQNSTQDNKIINTFNTEQELLYTFIEKFKTIEPDILVGFNSEFFDIPYLYYRICRVLGEDIARLLSPIGRVWETPWNFDKGQYLQIQGIESLDYYRLHKKYIWEDELSWTLDYIGHKYTGLRKIEYEGTLDMLFKENIDKFIEYNFRDVEILKALDEKLQYISLTKSISHKGKHNYSEVYANTKTQDGAISTYVLKKGIIPPSRIKGKESKKNYAGGYLLCPEVGIFNYMFDEDLTSLYPSIIITLNIGRETFMFRIISNTDRNNRLGLNDLENMNPNEYLIIETNKGQRKSLKISKIISIIKELNLSISANGVVFNTEHKSALAEILQGWFDERSVYKSKMKKAYESGDVKLGERYHFLQYTYKILLNSTYGALAIPSFRWGNGDELFAETTTLTGQRIIQESALFVNTHINKVMRGEIELGINN